MEGLNMIINDEYFMNIDKNEKKKKKKKKSLRIKFDSKLKET